MFKNGDSTIMLAELTDNFSLRLARLSCCDYVWNLLLRLTFDDLVVALQLAVVLAVDLGKQRFEGSLDLDIAAHVHHEIIRKGDLHGAAHLSRLGQLLRNLLLQIANGAVQLGDDGAKNISRH